MQQVNNPRRRAPTMHPQVSTNGAVRQVRHSCRDECQMKQGAVRPSGVNLYSYFQPRYITNAARLSEDEFGTSLFSSECTPLPIVVQCSNRHGIWHLPITAAANANSVTSMKSELQLWCIPTTQSCLNKHSRSTVRSNTESAAKLKCARAMLQYSYRTVPGTIYLHGPETGEA